MATVWLRLRADVRGRWRAMTALALLLGIVGGVVLTAAAGARRTDTAYPRLLRWANAADVTVIVTDPDPGSAGGSATGQPGPFTAGGPNAEAIRSRFFASLARLPEVASASRATEYNMALPVPGGQPDTQVQVFASPDDSLGVSGDAVKITHGRMFAATAAGEAVIDQQTADREHLRAGGTLRLIGIGKDATGAASFADAVPLSFRVTGIAVFDDKVVPATSTAAQPRILLSPPFASTRLAVTMTNLPEAGVRLRPGASVAALARDADTLRKRFGIADSDYTTVALSASVATTQSAIHPQAIALALFAVLAAVIALAVLGQLLARQVALDAMEFPILRAVGMTRAHLAAAALARLAIVTISGAILAAVAAFAASPVTPIGPARLAEPDPGLRADLPVLLPGLAGFALLPLAVLAPVAWRAARRAGGPLGVAAPASAARPSRLAAALSSAGVVMMAIGTRMAFEPGHGRTAVPVRSALGGTVVAVGAVVAALVFGTSLIGLVSTPGKYGQHWDQQLSLGYATVPGAVGAQLLAAAPGVAGYAAGADGEVSIGGMAVPAIAVDPVHGSGYLTLLNGHAPSGTSEIALGAQTMRALHVAVGQTVPVRVSWKGGTPGDSAVRAMRVTGTAVFPAFGVPAMQSTDLGSGAIVAAALLSSATPDTGCTEAAIRQGMACYGFFLLRYRPGADLAGGAAWLRAATAARGCTAAQCTVIDDQRPGRIRNYAGIRDTPLALGLVLAILAVGTLAHVLLTSVRRRRRDLAVLKALGCTRPQMLRIVAWQATALAGAALLIGVPVGVVAGRWAWQLFAGAAGVSQQADVPVPVVAGTVAGVLLLASLIAVWPGWRAARIRPALALRTE
jgi:ABC-type antimicrobial peptide transport system permease subunit